MPDKKKWEPNPRQIKWVRAYLDTGFSKAADRESEVPKATSDTWKTKPEFKAYLANEKLEWYERLHNRAMQLAQEGNATMIMFLMKSMNPEVHDDAIRKLKYMKENDIEDPQKEITFKIVDAERALDTSDELGSKADK